MWLSQIARGIKNILKYAHKGIKEWQEIEIGDKYLQLNLKLKNYINKISLFLNKVLIEV